MTELTAELVSAANAMVERLGIDTGSPGSVDTALWAALTDAGFTGIGISEESGGSGGELSDALAVLSAVTEKGALTPFLEHTILASWLAAAAGHHLAAGIATVAVADDRCRARTVGTGVVLDGVVSDVVHIAIADTLVVLLTGRETGARQTVAVIDLSNDRLTVTPGTDLLGTSVGAVTFDSTPTVFHEPSPIDGTEFEQRAALAYTVALAAVARAVRDETCRYATERTQFGRPLAKFQAVQQRLAGLAAITAFIDTAASSAVEIEGPGNGSLAIAAAKLVASSSAREVAAAGHQVHGAIGFTSEHRLGRFTTSLWTWRDRHGSERRWAEHIAAQILDNDIDLWDAVLGVGQAHGDRPRSTAEGVRP